MLIVFGGLPGTGKSAIAKHLARQCGATYLRIDVIEQAIRSTSPTGEIGAEGYVIANALAEANLRLAQTVIADAVNALPVVRDAWRSVAAAASCPMLEIEIVCSDEAEHRRRVESRTTDIPGLVLPSWTEVVERHYLPWPEADLVIDTARCRPDEAVAKIMEAMAARADSV